MKRKIHDKKNKVCDESALWTQCKQKVDLVNLPSEEGEVDIDLTMLLHFSKHFYFKWKFCFPIFREISEGFLMHVLAHIV